MDCVASKRGLITIMGYTSTINVANIDKVWGTEGWWDGSRKSGHRHISTFKVDNFFLRLFGKTLKKPRRWNSMFYGYHKPRLTIVMSGENHYYTFERNSDMRAEEKRVLEMMK